MFRTEKLQESHVYVHILVQARHSVIRRSRRLAFQTHGQKQYRRTTGGLGTRLFAPFEKSDRKEYRVYARFFDGSAPGTVDFAQTFYCLCGRQR